MVVPRYAGNSTARRIDAFGGRCDEGDIRVPLIGAAARHGFQSHDAAAVELERRSASWARPGFGECIVGLVIEMVCPRKSTTCR